MGFSFFKKDQASDKYEVFQAELTTFLTAHADSEIQINELNELARKADLYTIAYYATVGFTASNLQAELTAQIVSNPAEALAQRTKKEWQAEWQPLTATKSILNSVIGSRKNYFKLYVNPTALSESLILAEATFPETDEYQRDKKSGEFVLNTIKDLCYLCYRLDLANNDLMEEKNLTWPELATPSTLQPVTNTLQRLKNGAISNLDIQYMFTWLLQYSATITATSSLYSSYSSAKLPPEVCAQTEAIVGKLSENFANLSLSAAEATQDSLKLSQQLLDQIPDLFADANQKMAELDRQLLPSAEDATGDPTLDELLKKDQDQ